MLKRFTWSMLGVPVVLAVLGLYAVALIFGELNQDEGWYLYAAGMVRDGLLPYRDFAFTQGPVMAFAYALGSPLVSALGVAGGRLLTLVLGLAAIACAAILAWRLAADSKRTAAVVAVLALAGLNAYQACFFTVVKTYALTALLVGVGLLALLEAVRGRWPMAVASAVCLVLAAGTRLSAVFLLPVIFFYLLMERQRIGWRPCLAFVAGGALTAAIIFGPFVVLAPGGLWFGLVEYHGSRSGGGLLGLVYKAGSVARVLQAYIVAAVTAVVALVSWWRARAGGLRAGWTTESRFAAAVGLAVGLVALVHLAAPFPYDDYQTFLFPTVAVLVARALSPMLPDDAEGQRAWVGALALACMIGVAGAPALQNMFLGGQDRIWWRIRTTPQLVTLRRAAETVKGMAGPDRLLLTQDLYLAVEAGLRVPPGMELGPFSYYPDLPGGSADSRRVLNRERLEAILSGGNAQAAAFSGYGLAISSPQLTPIPGPERERLLGLVEARYERVSEITGFGQAGTTLILYRRRAGAGVGE